MGMTDTIADMLTRIRNANSARLEYADIPSSKIKKEILRILKDEGFISDYRMAEEAGHPWLRVYLKYSPKGDRVIQGVERVSLPGRRVFVGAQGIPRVLGGLGLSVLSTSKGVMAGYRARDQKLGGEVLCKIW